MDNRVKLSVITPAYRETGNLPLLYERLCGALESADIDWEWIVVDDHSPDETFTVISALAQRDSRIRGIRLSRNCGSHTAIMCGVGEATGDCSVVMAADLQDPPETISALIERWRAGKQVVWAVRAERKGEKLSTVAFARLYYWIMQRIVGMREMPGSGADFFLMDRRVMDALGEIRETNVSLFALVTWMGFAQDKMAYTKEARASGQSGWSLGKKVKLVVDSITSFSYLPIRLMTCVGVVVAALGFLYAGFVAIVALNGHPVSGWPSIIIVVLTLGGMQMLMMGILGEYLWRALDEARRRPRYMIERCTANLPPSGWSRTTEAPNSSAHPVEVKSRGIG